MPRIKDLSIAMEKKLDLTDFFGEEAFVIIKKIGKYQFSLLLNKNRSGYSAKIYSLILDYKSDNPDKTEITPEEYEKLTDLIPMEEMELGMSIEAEVNRSYCELSIKKDGHNFLDDSGKEIELDGGWFYNEYSGIKNSEGREFSDFLISEIVGFNHKGLSLGESNASK